MRKLLSLGLKYTLALNFFVSSSLFIIRFIIINVFFIKVFTEMVVIVTEEINVGFFSLFIFNLFVNASSLLTY